MKIRKMIYSDFIRYYGYERSSFLNFLKCYFTKSGFKFMFWFRLTLSKHAILRWFATFQHARFSRKYFLDIPIGTKIGYGFFIAHGCNVMINKSTIIGNNVNVSQFTTIGSNYNQAAIIGDNVYIGPSVSIIENVNIGSNSIIGAGAVVVKDVSSNTTVAGVPAKEINNKNKHEFIIREYHS